ncbi:sensor histidine kinase [Pseudorhodoferax sp.]|uniref:sensor histidine kinase n=1 Tax=Pseudorhodoferax sp. TaxID=1993553 RepID=UPI001B41B9B6|nr:histidine kinase [Pseudorhodoferax sp.]MBP8146196.1 histidine kinase [Inhella sp.]
MRFLDTLRAARKDFFKLKKQREEPAWALWTLTLLVSLAWGGGFLLLGWLLGGKDFTRLGWSRTVPPFLVTALLVGIVIHTLYSAIERWAPQRFIDWTNGEPTAGVSAFFAATSIAGVLVGLFLARELLGGLPGSERVHWNMQRTWASFGGVALFASIVWGMWAWQEWSERQLKLQAKEAELKLLQAQIEPHYLFNTLANVRSLIDCDAPAAGELLDAFTEHLRASLTLMRADTVALADELDMVGHYLRLMQLRMGDRLHFRIEADEAVRRVSVPPLLLQPLVENAIHHGLECSIEPGTVVVRAQLTNGTLRLSVEDDGVGLDATRPQRKGNGVATRNIRERLHTRWGDAARLTLAPRQPRGVVATLEFPADLPT